MADNKESREPTKSSSESGWAVVNKEGEVVSEDGDSESSGCSAENFSPEEIAEAAKQQDRSEELKQDEVVVTTCESSANLAVSRESLPDQNTRSIVSLPDEDDSIEGHVMPPCESVHIVETPAPTKLSQPVSGGDVEVEDGKSEKKNGDEKSEETNEDRKSVGSSDDEKSMEQSGNEKSEKENEDNKPMEANTSSIPSEKDSEVQNTSECEMAESGALSTTASSKGDDVFSPLKALSEKRGAYSSECMEDNTEGACCGEQPQPDSLSACAPDFAPDSFDESGLSQDMAGAHSGSYAQPGSKCESDAESDFVQVDPEDFKNMDDSMDFVDLINNGANMNRGGGDQPRQRLPDSSIQPNFNFLQRIPASVSRGPPDREPDNLEEEEDRAIAPAPVNQGPPEREPADLEEEEEEDGDEDTESSTEEGVDDRIESEQSEAGSQSVHNDVGDLSQFADIGDLPLDAGDVRRNYIHRPNNHLSTVLNIIVVLAAILTMGISLGIIMATDLEIEEWQNAYEMQTRRVSELQYQLEYKGKVIKELEPQLQEMRNLAVKLTVQAENYERALDFLSKQSQEWDENAGQVMGLIYDAIKYYIICEEKGGKGSCSEKLRPFVQMYSRLINGDSTFDVDSNPHPDPDLSYTFEDEETLEDIEGEIENSIESSDYRQSNEHVYDNSANLASPVSLDIKLLQHSLTREQERALHWQHLYLSQRRQLERERENEEWEDERERELWEKEKEDLQQVECLKKLMSANLTTLTQHVVKWNVSVFDDFANLSMLLSGVAEMKQSVMDSVNKVLESAGEIFDKVQSSEGEKSGGANWQDRVPMKELLTDFITRVLDSITEGTTNKKEIVAEYLSKTLGDLKKGVEDILQDVRPDSVVDLVNKLWEGADDIMVKLQQNLEEVIKRQDTGESIPDKKVLVAYLTKVLGDIQHEVKGVLDVVKSEEVDELEPKSNAEIHRYPKYAIDSSEEETKAEHIPSSDDIQGQDYEHQKHGTWYRRIGGLLKKTGSSVRKLGRHVVGTWKQIKTIWLEEKPIWHKVKAIWHERKPHILNLAKRFSGKVMRVGSKLSKLCIKHPKIWSHDDEKEFGKVDIHSKCAWKLRKQWQKKVLKYPCETVGKFSFECNAGHKELKKNLKEVSHWFPKLLEIRTLQPQEVLSLKEEEAVFIYNLFQSFQSQWGNTKLLPKSDLDWVECHTKWWQTALSFNHNKDVSGLGENLCDTVIFPDGGQDEQYSHVLNKDEHSRENKFRDDYDDDEDDDEDGQIKDYDVFSDDAEEYQGVREKVPLGVNEEKEQGWNKAYVPVDMEKVLEQEKEKKEENKFVQANAEERNETGVDEDWYLERARHRLKVRKEKEREELASDKGKQRDENKKSQQGPTGKWMFEKANGRDRWRKEERKADWMFDRANDRENKHAQKFEKNGQRAYDDDKDEPDDWYLKTAEQRQKIREEQHKADWLFDRASERKKRHRKVEE